MTDDFVNLLEVEQSNPNAILIEILGDDYSAWDFIVAVEGPDDRKFYFDLIRDMFPEQNPKFFSCGGKNGLVAFQEVADDYDWVEKPVLMYLADKDFDDYLGISHGGIFKTEFYSIESYFLGWEFVDYIIERGCSRPLTRLEKEEFQQEFMRSFEDAVEKVRPVCALMCEIRAHGEHPQFDDFGIDKIFNLNNGFEQRHNILEDMKRQLSAGAGTTSHQIAGRIRSFSMNDFKKWLRGKLGFQLMKKAYELTRSRMSENTANKLPHSNAFGSEAFSLSKAFIGRINALENYCRQCFA